MALAETKYEGAEICLSKNLPNSRIYCYVKSQVQFNTLYDIWFKSIHDVIGVRRNIFIMITGDHFMEVTLLLSKRKAIFLTNGYLSRWNDNCKYTETTKYKT